MQKFIKETTKKKLVIPNAVLELGGLEKGEPVEKHYVVEEKVFTRENAEEFLEHRKY